MLGNPTRILPTSLVSWSSLNAEGANLADSVRRVEALDNPLRILQILPILRILPNSDRANLVKSVKSVKSEKLSDGAVSIAPNFSDGSGSARLDSRGGHGIVGAGKIRDEPPTVLTVSTAHIWWKVREV